MEHSLRLPTSGFFMRKKLIFLKPSMLWGLDELNPDILWTRDSCWDMILSIQGCSSSC